MRPTLALLVVSYASVGCEGRDEAAESASEPIARSGPMAVYEAFAPAPILIESAALYFTLRNDGAEPDTLLSVSGQSRTVGFLRSSPDFLRKRRVNV